MIGRLVADPEVRYSQGQQSTAVARYRLAVDRRYKGEGEQSADFISCVAFGKNGEFAEKYLKKGIKIAVVGRIQTGSYVNRDGAKVYTTDVVCEEQYFCESSRSSSGSGSQGPAPAYTPPASSGTRSQGIAPAYRSASNDGFACIPDNVDDFDLPFN